MVVVTVAVTAVIGQSPGQPRETRPVADQCSVALVYGAAPDKVLDAILAYTKGIEEGLEANRKPLQIRSFKAKTESDRASGLIVHRIVIRRGAGNAVSPASYEVLNRTFWVRPVDAERTRMTATIRAYGWWDSPKPMRPGSHEQVYNWSLWGCDSPDLKLGTADVAGTGSMVR